MMDESDADYEAGRFVPGDVVAGYFKEALDRHAATTARAPPAAVDPPLYCPRRPRCGALISHYIDKGRPEAVGVLFRALSNASAAIRAETAASLPAPRPYPAVVRPTWVWMKAGSY